MGFVHVIGYVLAVVFGLLFTAFAWLLSMGVSLVIGILVFAGFASSLVVYAIADFFKYIRSK